MLRDKVTSLNGFRDERAAAALKARVREIRTHQENLEALAPAGFLGQSAADVAADAVDRGLTLLRIREGAREMQLSPFLKTNATLASPVLGEVMKSLEADDDAFELGIVTDLVDHVYAERIGRIADDVTTLLAGWPGEERVSLSWDDLDEGVLRQRRDIDLIKVADSARFKSVFLRSGPRAVAVVVEYTPQMRAEVHLRLLEGQALQFPDTVLEHFRSPLAIRNSPFFQHKHRGDSDRNPLYASEHDAGYIASAYEDLEFQGHWTTSHAIMRFLVMREVLSLLMHLRRRGIPGRIPG